MPVRSGRVCGQGSGIHRARHFAPPTRESRCNVRAISGVIYGMTLQVAWTDADLVEGIAARRDGAFEVLVDTYTDRLYSLAWRVTGSREDAEEAVQDALVKAHRALYGSYSPMRVRELALRPWLYAVTLNAARNRRRGRRVSDSLDALDGSGRRRLEPPATDPSPVAIAEGGELAAGLERALQELPPRQRTAVVLRLVEGLSYEEAALTLGCPIGTVKSDVHRGLRRLRELLRGVLE